MIQYRKFALKVCPQATREQTVCIGFGFCPRIMKTTRFKVKMHGSFKAELDVISSKFCVYYKIRAERPAILALDKLCLIKNLKIISIKQNWGENKRRRPRFIPSPVYLENVRLSRPSNATRISPR
jgi:hypothetical protein